MSTDSDLIAASAGDPDAFGLLFDRHAVRLHRYLARRSDWSTAQDLVGETFVVAFENRSRFDGRREDALPWLFGIATNLLRRHQRSEVRRQRASARVGPEEIAPDHVTRVDDQLAAQRSFALIEHALAQMSAADRDTVLLFAWAELSYEQIAEATAVPVGTVRSRLNRARRRLRAALDTPNSPTVDSQPGGHHERHPAPYPSA